MHTYLRQFIDCSSAAFTYGRMSCALFKEVLQSLAANSLRISLYIPGKKAIHKKRTVTFKILIIPQYLLYFITKTNTNVSGCIKRQNNLGINEQT